jgi:succinate dehydrogenase / fumarate reductase membrane anchor subunit
MANQFTNTNGSTKTGHSHWWAQRTTGVLLVPLTLWFFVLLASQETHTFENMRALLEHIPTAIAFTLLTLSMTYHSFLGVQVVLEDYVHHQATLLVSLFLAQIFHLIVALASLFAILRINLGR